MIDEYAKAVSSKLAFDPQLAQRIREEISDHLYESANRIEADPQQREAIAISRFDCADQFVKEFIRESINQKLRKTGYVFVLAIVTVFGAMRFRSYFFPEYLTDLRYSGVPGTLLFYVDRYAFILAIAGLISCFAVHFISKSSLYNDDNTITGVDLVPMSFGMLMITFSSVAGAIIASIVADIDTRNALSAHILDITFISTCVCICLFSSYFTAKILFMLRRFAIESS